MQVAGQVAAGVVLLVVLGTISVVAVVVGMLLSLLLPLLLDEAVAVVGMPVFEVGVVELPVELLTSEGVEDLLVTVVDD